MRWTVKGFYKKIYLEYGLKLEGWPEDVLFADLSKVTGLARISRLLVLWQTGIMCFVPVGVDRAVRAAVQPEDAVPSPLHLGLPPRLGRSDLKKHRGSRKVDPERFPARYIRNGPKSEKWITAAAEARAEMGVSGLEDPNDPIELW